MPSREEQRPTAVPEFRCGTCGRVFDAERGVRIRRYVTGSILRCMSCDTEGNFCNYCGEQIQQGRYYDTNTWGAVCESCFETYCLNEEEEELEEDPSCSESENIYNAGFKPRYKFHQEEGEKRPQFFGFELEVEVNEDEDRGRVAKKLIDELNSSHVYLKHDGSLNYGFEIVTQPMTRAYAQKNLNLKRIIYTLQQSKCRSYDYKSCGFHVHMDKTLSEMEEIKLGALVFGNKALFEKVGQRKSNSYASFGVSTDTVYLKEINKLGERYFAVNFQNDSTIEFRFFKGTLNAERITAHIELCHFLFDVVRSKNLKQIMLCNTFLAMGFDNYYSKKYPVLAKKLGELQLLPYSIKKEMAKMRKDIHNRLEELKVNTGNEKTNYDMGGLALCAS